MPAIGPKISAMATLAVVSAVASAGSVVKRAVAPPINLAAAAATAVAKSAAAAGSGVEGGGVARGVSTLATRTSFGSVIDALSWFMEDRVLGPIAKFFKL